MVKILIAGDFCPYDRVVDIIEKDNFSSIFDGIRICTSKADYSILNFESPVVETNAPPISKCGPNLRCSSKAVKALKYAGFDMVTLANNHILDFGEDGVNQTLDACNSEGIDTIGVGNNLFEASKILYKDIKGIKVAFINCCEHEFSIATDSTMGANPLNPIRQFYSIQEAKSKADKVVVIVHGGHEYYQLPSPRMQETYRFFINVGADAVINHHQHCYSGYEIYNEKPIFYGLGNFCFDDTKECNMIWNEGYMVILNFNELVSFDIIPYTQGTSTVGVKMLENRHSFDEKISKLNSIIINKKQLREKHEKWISTMNLRYKSILLPYSNRIELGLYRRGLLPSYISESRKNRALNYIECESHLDCLRYVLRNSVN